MLTWLVEVWDWITSIRVGARQARERHHNTLEGTVAAQKVTIEAYQKQLNLVGASAVLKEVQAHQAIVEALATTRVEQQTQQLREKATQSFELMAQIYREGYAELSQDYSKTLISIMWLLNNVLPFVYPDVRKHLIDAAELPPEIKALLQQSHVSIGNYPITDEASWKAFQGPGLRPMWMTKDTSRQPPQESSAP